MELKTYSSLCAGVLNSYCKHSLPLSILNPHHNQNSPKDKLDKKSAILKDENRASICSHQASLNKTTMLDSQQENTVNYDN